MLSHNGQRASAKRSAAESRDTRPKTSYCRRRQIAQRQRGGTLEILIEELAPTCKTTKVSEDERKNKLLGVV